MAAQPFRGYEQRRDVERSADWEPLVVCSLKEGDAIDMERESQPAWIAHNRSNLSRVYPKGSRMDSSNMADTLLCRLWGAGVQMAALNFQTFDQSSMLNEVRGLRELSAQRDGGERWWGMQPHGYMGNVGSMWAQCGLRDNPSPLLHLLLHLLPLLPRRPSSHSTAAVATCSSPPSRPREQCPRPPRSIWSSRSSVRAGCQSQQTNGGSSGLAMNGTP